jgi:hypothetical protein
MWSALVRLAALVPAAFVFASGTAFAVTLNFAGTVTSVPALPPAGAVFPPLGTAGAVTFSIDDSDPGALLFDPGSFTFFAAMSATVDVPGFLSFTGDYDNPSVAPGFFSIGNYGPSNLVNGGASTYFANALHSIRFSFGAGVSDPTTVGELIAAIQDPGTTGFFRHEAERQGGGFFFTDVSFSSASAVVPLPGSLALMLGGLALGGLLVRRRRAPGAA